MASVVSSISVSRARGKRVANGPATSGSRHEASVGMTPTRSVPSGSVSRSPASRARASASRRTPRARVTTRSPAAVGTTGWRLRSNRTAPSSSSSFLSAALSVGCETKQAAAARPKWRCVSTATA